MQEIQKKKMADQAQEYQYQQAVLYINNEENLNLIDLTMTSYEELLNW